MALYGFDLSDNQPTSAVDEARDFVILKATYGTGFVETDCDNKYQRAKSQGKKLGVYHVCYNRLNSAVDEANWFADNIQGYLGEAIPFVDNERWVSKANGALLNDPTDVAWQEAFNAQFYARTKVRDPEYMNANNTGLADWSPVAAQNALWCAGYPARFDIANPPTPAEDGSDMPYDTHAWPFATFWQYSSSAGTLDRDIFYGTAEAWDKFAMGDRQATPPPAPVVTPPPVQAPIVIPVQTPVVVNDPLPPTPVTTPTVSPSPSSTPSLPTSKPPTVEPIPVVVTLPETFLEKLAHYQKGVVAFLTVELAWVATNSYLIPQADQHWYQLALGLLGASGVVAVPNKPKS